MGKIVVSGMASLDGVIEDPAGDEGFSRGGWVGLMSEPWPSGGSFRNLSQWVTKERRATGIKG